MGKSMMYTHEKSKFEIANWNSMDFYQTWLVTDSTGPGEADFDIRLNGLNYMFEEEKNKW